MPATKRQANGEKTKERCKNSEGTRKPWGTNTGNTDKLIKNEEKRQTLIHRGYLTDDTQVRKRQRQEE